MEKYLSELRCTITEAGQVFKDGKLKPYGISNSGYCLVYFHKNGKTVAKTIHRLVATAFIPNPENKPQVNHINGIKTDNRVENLEWVTAKENSRHSFDFGLMEGAKKKAAKRMKEIGKKYSKENGDRLRHFSTITSTKVIQKTLSGEYVATHLSISEAERVTGACAINKVLAGKRRQAKGFLWERA